MVEENNTLSKEMVLAQKALEQAKARFQRAKSKETEKKGKRILITKSFGEVLLRSILQSACTLMKKK